MSRKIIIINRSTVCYHFKKRMRSTRTLILSWLQKFPVGDWDKSEMTQNLRHQILQDSSINQFTNLINARRLPIAWELLAISDYKIALSASKIISVLKMTDIGWDILNIEKNTDISFLHEEKSSTLLFCHQYLKTVTVIMSPIKCGHQHHYIALDSSPIFYLRVVENPTVIWVDDC